MEKPDRKTEILHMSAKLFRERGYSAVSMRDIAQALNIKAASLYNHIASKQEILVLIVIEIAREFTAGMHSIAENEKTAIEKLQQIIEQQIDLTLRNPNEMACLNNDWMHLEFENRSNFIRMREEYEGQLRKIVLDGMKSGELKELDVDVVIFSILSTLRTLNLWYGRKKTIEASSLKDTMIEVLLRGIVV